jgi:hypothetical protein
MDGPDGVAPPGSGKQDTPCERMHSAKASCAEVLEAPVAAEPLGRGSRPARREGHRTAFKARAAPTLTPAGSPHQPSCRRPPRHWGSRTKIRLGARAHATPDTASTRQLLHHGRLTRPTAQIRNQRSRCGRQTAASIRHRCIDAGLVRARAVAGRAAGEWDRRYPEAEEQCRPRHNSAVALRKVIVRDRSAGLLLPPRRESPRPDGGGRRRIGPQAELPINADVGAGLEDRHAQPPLNQIRS